MAIENEENITQPEEEQEVSETIVPHLTFEILKLIKDAQQQHGLRHGDYQRYHGYCSRRVRRLRKVLKLTQSDRRHYKRRDVTINHLEDSQSDIRYLEICLMLTERAWAYAMQLRQEMNTEPRKKYHLINRLRKAISCATVLETLANTDYCDARTKLEAHAYKTWILGTYYFELEQWKSSMENFTITQKIYLELANSLPLEEQAAYKARCDEVAPSIRYCAYNISGGDTSSININTIGNLEGLDTLMQQAKQRRTEEFVETEWRGYKFSIRPERVRLFLISIQNIDESLKTATEVAKRIELYEQLLMDCKECVQLVKDEIKNDPKLKAPAGEPLTGSQMLLSYLTYLRLTYTIERNLCLVEQAKGDSKKTKPQEFARFYEIILQNITDLQQLAGFEDNEKYQSEISLQAKCFKGFRCLYMAKTLEALKRFTDAYALYEQSASYASSVLADKKSTAEQKSRVKALLEDIDKSKYIAHAQVVLENIDSTETEEAEVKKPMKKVKIKKPLEERLDEFVEDPSVLTTNPNIVKYPPELEPVPCKPLFFDLANNLIEYPNLDDKVDPAKVKGKEQAGAGLTGFVKGLWGWGSKK